MANIESTARPSYTSPASELIDIYYRINKALELTKMKLAEDYSNTIYKDVIRTAPYATGEYVFETRKIVTYGFTFTMGRVVSRAIHAQPVEFGRRPGAKVPPYGYGSRLREWCLIILGSDDTRTVRRVAHAIARRGIRGKFIFKRTWESFVKRLTRQLVSDVKKCMKTFLGI